jgi:hypothetical protein
MAHHLKFIGRNLSIEKQHIAHKEQTPTHDPRHTAVDGRAVRDQRKFPNTKCWLIHAARSGEYNP